MSFFVLHQLFLDYDLFWWSGMGGISILSNNCLIWIWNDSTRLWIFILIYNLRKQLRNEHNFCIYFGSSANDTKYLHLDLKLFDASLWMIIICV